MALSDQGYFAEKEALTRYLTRIGKAGWPSGQNLDWYIKSED
jgi:hypothetical protein